MDSKIFRYQAESKADLRAKLEPWLRKYVFTEGQTFSFTIDDDWACHLKWEIIKN